SLNRVLEELVRVSCDVPADFSAIRILSADHRSLLSSAMYHRDPSHGEQLRTALDTPMPPNRGYTKHVLETGKSILVPVVARVAVDRAYVGTPFGDYIARFPMSTVMLVPLSSDGSVFGVMAVARYAPEPFQPPDLHFLEEIADRAIAALDNANLLEHL